MTLLNSCRRPIARMAVGAGLMLFTFIATGRAETWTLEVETARVVTGKSGEYSYLRIRLTGDGASQLAELEEAKARGKEKARPKEIRVDGLPVAAAMIELKRGELRVTIQGLDGDKALALTERLNDKRARVEVVETAAK
jgi:hypothetical protein